MLMCTWDYLGFAIGPVLTPLASIFDQKNSVFPPEGRTFLTQWVNFLASVCVPQRKIGAKFGAKRGKFDVFGANRHS